MDRREFVKVLGLVATTPLIPLTLENHISKLSNNGWDKMTKSFTAPKSGWYDVKIKDFNYATINLEPGTYELSFDFKAQGVDFTTSNVKILPKEG